MLIPCSGHRLLSLATVDQLCNNRLEKVIVMVKGTQKKNQELKGSARKVYRDGPHPVDVYVGDRVRTLRTLCGLNQSQLGEVLGLTFQQVQKYESGFNRISAGKLWRISQLLGCEISWFFESAEKALGQSNDEMISRETLQLVRYYENFPNKATQEDFRKLVFSAAKNL